MLVNLTDQDISRLPSIIAVGTPVHINQGNAIGILVWYHRLTILAHISMEVGLEIERRTRGSEVNHEADMNGM